MVDSSRCSDLCGTAVTCTTLQIWLDFEALLRAKDRSRLLGSKLAILKPRGLPLISKKVDLLVYSFLQLPAFTDSEAESALGRRLPLDAN
jgi:hypothetical protein